MEFLEKIECGSCKFNATPEKFPDIETRSITKKDFEDLSQSSKNALQRFGHDISDMDCRLNLHGSILICPNCGNTENFDFKTKGE